MSDVNIKELVHAREYIEESLGGLDNERCHRYRNAIDGAIEWVCKNKFDYEQRLAEKDAEIATLKASKSEPCPMAKCTAGFNDGRNGGMCVGTGCQWFDTGTERK